MAIEAPINVTPDNETVYIDKTLDDPTSPWSDTPPYNDYSHPLTIGFTFNGDNLSWWRCEYYDAETGAVLGYSYAPRNQDPWEGRYRNGDNVEINAQVATNLFQNGTDYKYRLILYQAYQSGSNYLPLCDMLCVTGRVVEASGTTITVETGVTDIDAPYVMDGHTIGQCMIEVVGDNNGTLVKNKIKITSYSKASGVITLDSAFVGTIAAGTRYKIYRNYYKSPYYYVRCRSKAQITPSVSINAATGGVQVSAGWSIASEEEVSLQKYKWTIGGIEGKEIYSYHDKGALPSRGQNAVTLDAVFPILACQNISGKLTTTTQDGYVQDTEVSMTSGLIQGDADMFTLVNEVTTNNGYRVEYKNGIAMMLDQNRVGIKVKLAAGSSYTNFKLWKRKGMTGHYRYVGNCQASTISGEKYVIGYDNAPEDDIVYEYAVSAENSGTFRYKSVGTAAADYQERVVIEKLSRKSDYFGLACYRPSGRFAFDFEIGKPTFNIEDGQAIIKTGGKPIVIKESGRYLSGDFSAAITQMSVLGYSYDLTDNNDTYKRALEFFDDSEYLIKIPDRGCLIAKITGKSLKKNEAGATILSFSFTQTKSADEVIVYDGSL